MKKRLLLALLCPAICLLGGCQEYASEKFEMLTAQSAPEATVTPTETPVPSQSQPKTQIDELAGTLLAFDGDHILVRLEDNSVYTFDVSKASLECKQGMLSGNPVVIIYEGTCNLAHPDTLDILKVSDPVDSTEPRVRTAVGTVTDYTLNTLSIRTKAGDTLRFQTTGTEQFYSQGLDLGASVYVHFQGNFHKDKTGNLDTTNVKVLDISDVENIPEPTPTPSPDPSLDEKDQLKYLTGTITSLKDYTLRIRPTGAEKSLKIDLRHLTARFPYGLHVGSRATISYTGVIRGAYTKKAQILSIVGEDLPRLTEAQQTASVSGTVQKLTQNTFTMFTEDLALLTFDLSSLPDRDLLELKSGDGVSVTYNPIRSSNTALYTALELQILRAV